MGHTSRVVDLRQGPDRGEEQGEGSCLRDRELQLRITSFM